MVFFDQDWVPIGTKLTLRKRISWVTGIKDLSNFETACVAQKMSWASKRHTTRVEDMAYCLMGLFGVNMPPLYGEGHKAFIRLQLEILSMSDDESIFAWTDGNDSYSTGLLARSPAAFENSGDVIRRQFYDRSPYSMTNQGLSIEMRLEIPEPRQDHNYPGIFLAPFNCTRTGLQENSKPLAIFVEGRHCTDSANWNQYVRRFSDTLITTDYSKKPCLCGPAGKQGMFHGVLYFKQPEISGTRQMANSHIRYEFSIDVGYLLGLGFSISGKHLVSLEQCASSISLEQRASSIRTSKWGEIQSQFGQCVRVGASLTIEANNVMGALMLTKEGVERVVVLLYVWNHRARVDLLTGIKFQPLREIVHSYCKSQKFNDLLRGFDPTSKILRSGTSVRLFLDYDSTIIGGTGGRLHKVEIVDEKGPLRENWDPSWSIRF
jgi:hypothetical protein